MKGKSITTYLTQAHLQQSQKGKVLVMVENEDDISFWKGIFELFEVKTRIIAGISTRKELQRGKDTVLKQKENANKLYLLCVDSDYDYLIGNDEKGILSNPFIFHTYTYSYENYLCLSKTLTTLCTSICASDEFEFNFVLFFEEYSKIVYPLFLYHLYDKIKHQSQNFSIQQFHALIDFPQHPKTVSNGESILNKIQKNVSSKLKMLEKEAIVDKNELQDLAIQLELLGLNAQNCYLFVRGHNLFDNTSRLIDQVCFPIIEAQKNQLYKMGKFGDAKLNEYLAIIKTTKVVLKENRLYEKCELFEKVKQDFERYKQLS
jgi:hypothetical protein